MPLRPLIHATTLCFLLVSTSSPAQPSPAAGNSSEAGLYCPASAITDVMLEELSLAFAELAQADHALADNRFEQANQHLTRAAMALSLASSRGRAAQTAQLIDAVINSKASEDYQQMLAYFPLLRSALLALPENTYTNAADEAISTSEAILDGERQGNALEQLRTARHWLSCDQYSLPATEAAQALSRLQQPLLTGKQPGSAMFEAAYAPLTRAINAIMELRQQHHTS